MIEVQAQNLFCERDAKVLFNGLNFRARGGEIWQVVGPNGAGKTTLLRIIAGLFQFYEGELGWKGIERGANSPLLYLGHRAGLREELTALENLSWLAALHDQSQENIPLALEAVGLAGYDTVAVADMSAGQKRRVALARLWLPGKQVWILDEPFTALDKDGVALIEQRLREFAQEGGLVIYTSHHKVDDTSEQIMLGTFKEQKQ